MILKLTLICPGRSTTCHQSSDDPDHEYSIYNHEPEDFNQYDFPTDDVPDLVYISGPTIINPEPAMPVSYSLQDCISRAQWKAALSSEPIVEKQECEDEREVVFEHDRLPWLRFSVRRRSIRRSAQNSPAAYRGRRACCCNRFVESALKPVRFASRSLRNLP